MQFKKRQSKKRKKRAVTLIEIMIVILLIGLIGGALAFNMRGSMDKGRLFKTNQNCERIYDTLMLAAAAGEFDIANYNDRKEIKNILNRSPFLKDGDKALVDAWGEDIVITLKDGELEVYSERARKLENGQAKK